MRGRQDEYFGTLVNSYLAAGGHAVGIRAGESYVDVGTIDGYRTAVALLAKTSEADGRRLNVRLPRTRGTTIVSPSIVDGGLA